MEAINRYLEFDHAPQDWTAGSLADETREVAQMLKRKHPQLSEITLQALANKWSYDWK